MDHLSHEHPLILNEDYFARGGDTCNACTEEIVSCKSFVFSCSRRSITGILSSDARDVDEKCIKFLLHKTCAQLPRRIESPRHGEEFLDLHINPRKRRTHVQRFFHRPADVCLCKMCAKQMPWLYCSPGFLFSICIKCAKSQVDSLKSRKFEHQSHIQHQLTFIQRPSSFKCDACDVEDNTKDMSYKCVDCPFWMHKSCADAPASFLFHFHDKHPLVLSFSLPQFYHKFGQHCRLCNEKLGELNWLYYCSKCRYFAHFQCARSRQMLRSSENEEYPDLVYLPAATESAVNLLFEQFIKEMSSPKNEEEECSSRGRLKDWAHDEHLLQLVTVNELNDRKDALLLCDGCVKPIRNDGDLFYACVPCKFYLHKFCGELPTMFPSDTMLYNKYSKPYELFRCASCRNYGSGMSFRYKPTQWSSLEQHIGCSAVPKMIKHESHTHPLHLLEKDHYSLTCKACGVYSLIFHACEGCDFHICGGCIMKASRVKHQWDPHPLHLIYDPGMVEDHEHDYQCEFCSQDLDPNFWFYHCNHCDLSFHLRCYEKSYFLDYSNIKFGATNIIIDRFHRHSLAFVLNNKFRHCGKCKRANIGQPVLECAPCKTIFCNLCF